MVDEPLTVVVEGPSIIVTSAARISPSPIKSNSVAHLVLTHASITASRPAPVTAAIHRFRARAFHAAVEKARKLGWIV